MRVFVLLCVVCNYVTCQISPRQVLPGLMGVNTDRVAFLPNFQNGDMVGQVLNSGQCLLADDNVPFALCLWLDGNLVSYNTATNPPAPLFNTQANTLAANMGATVN